MSQQLSTKVADVFHRRFIALYKTKNPSTAEIAATPFETLRSIGLSNAKANYVINVCNFFIEENITDTKLYQIDRKSVV